MVDTRRCVLKTMDTLHTATNPKRCGHVPHVGFFEEVHDDEVLVAQSPGVDAMRATHRWLMSWWNDDAWKNMRLSVHAKQGKARGAVVGHILLTRTNAKSRARREEVKTRHSDKRARHSRRKPRRRSTPCRPRQA
jgi:hypothetical protein